MERAFIYGDSFLAPRCRTRTCASVPPVEVMAQYPTIEVVNLRAKSSGGCDKGSVAVERTTQSAAWTFAGRWWPTAATTATSGLGGHRRRPEQEHLPHTVLPEFIESCAVRCRSWRPPVCS